MTLRFAIILAFLLPSFALSAEEALNNFNYQNPQTIKNLECFIAKENDQIIKQIGNCKTIYSPNSSFKIAIALMGYDDGILLDENHPTLPFPKSANDAPKRCKKAINPREWMKNSCVWYSQEITKKLGMEKFRTYVEKFDYGNRDVTGDSGMNNGLTHSWLSSSIKISPLAQISFLEKLASKKLPVSKASQELTSKLIFIEKLPSGWDLYGKTGTGFQVNADGSLNRDLQIGWFVGFIEKENRRIFFATLVKDKEKLSISAGPRAKEMAKQLLPL